MKKILLFATAFLFVAMAGAQTKRSKDYLNGGNDTTWHNLNGPKKRTKITNGDVRIHSEPGKYDLYVTYKNKKATDYYAIDTKGNKLPVSIVTRPAATSSGGFKCYACVKVCNEAGKCAESCTEDKCPDGMGIINTNTRIKSAL